MPFEKGNKLGKGNGKARIIEEAIRRAVSQEDGKRIRAGVEKLLDLFADGDLQAFHAVADRLDGRPNQQIDMNVSREVRDYTVEELLENLGRIRSELERGANSDPRRDAGAEAGASEPASVH